jgi:hypothetical protein
VCLPASESTFTAPGTLKNGNDIAVAADDGFTTDKKTKGKEETSSTSAQSLKKNKQPMIGVRNSSLLTVAKRIRMKYHFVCRFAPEVSTTDIENSVSDQLKLC